MKRLKKKTKQTDLKIFYFFLFYNFYSTPSFFEEYTHTHTNDVDRQSGIKRHGEVRP